MWPITLDSPFRLPLPSLCCQASDTAAGWPAPSVCPGPSALCPSSGSGHCRLSLYSAADSFPLSCPHSGHLQGS